MKLKNTKFILAMGIVILSLVGHSAIADDGDDNVIWTPTFFSIMPNKAGITEEYCLTHTPNVLSTTIGQITSKAGVKAENGVYIKYDSYKTSDEHGVYFNVVNAKVWGKDSKGAWSSPMWLYEQTLTPTGVTNTVWATPDCKGKFIGVAHNTPDGSDFVTADS